MKQRINYKNNLLCAPPENREGYVRSYQMFGPPCAQFHILNECVHEWKTHIKVLLVGLVRTLAVDTPLPFATAGAVRPREVFGLAHGQPARRAGAPERGARARRVGAVFGLLPEGELALPVGIVQGPGEIRGQLYGGLRLVHQTFP